ncbi:MAG: hypothetical protein ABIH88_00420 [Patescibacteria group bacterium]
MKKINIPIFLIIIIVFLAVAQIFITHSLASSSAVAGEIELKIARLEEETEILKGEINELGSLRRVISEAEAHGFMAQIDMIYLSEAEAVAMKE